MEPKNILAANLKTLMAHRADRRTLPQITRACGLSNGKLDRIRRAAAPTDITSLGLLAEAFGLQPWQLLVKDLNPERLPILAGQELLTEIRQIVDSVVTPPGTQPQTGAEDAAIKRTPVKKNRTASIGLFDVGTGKTDAVGKSGGVSKQRRRKNP